MPLLNSGRNFIAQAIMNDSPTFFNNANSYLAVGDSSTAYDEAQTDLQAASNKYREAMESSYPQRTANVLTFRAIMETGDANFAWNEWGVANASSGGTLLNRMVESLGTKTSAQSWQLTVDLTIVNEDATP